MENYSPDGEVVGDNLLIPAILNVQAESLSVDLGNGKAPVIPLLEIYYPCQNEDLETLHKPWAEWATEQSVTARRLILNCVYLVRNCCIKAGI